MTAATGDSTCWRGTMGAAHGIARYGYDAHVHRARGGKDAARRKMGQARSTFERWLSVAEEWNGTTMRGQLQQWHCLAGHARARAGGSGEAARAQPLHSTVHFVSVRLTDLILTAAVQASSTPPNLSPLPNLVATPGRRNLLPLVRCSACAMTFTEQLPLELQTLVLSFLEAQQLLSTSSHLCQRVA